ncbi:hypothetical protein [Arthrobacter sp.]|uniref:hypothetical protein n=1 Tax=Arthrobacter sp. TaxID=1667 RepID=UPI0028A0A564|nr:hypothetical protein [Arthrobacter sp.]
MRRLLVELLFLGPFCLLVWMYSDYGWIAAVVSVTIMFFTADLAGRWGSAQAAETAKYREEWLARRKKSPHSDGSDARSSEDPKRKA